MNIRTAFISLVGMSAKHRMASAMPSFFSLQSAPSPDSSLSDQFGVARDSGGREFPEDCLNSPLEFKFDKDTSLTCVSVTDENCEDPRKFARERVQTHCSRSCSNRLDTECKCDDSTAPFFFEESITRCEDEIVGDNCDKVQIRRTCPRTCRVCRDQIKTPDWCMDSPYVFKVQGETLSCPMVEDEDCDRARVQSHCSKRCAQLIDTVECECSDSTAPFQFRGDWRFCGTGFIKSYCDSFNIQKTCPETCGICPSIALAFVVDMTFDNGIRISSSKAKQLVRDAILEEFPSLCPDGRKLNQVSRGNDTLVMKVNEKSSGDFDVTVSVHNSHDQSLSDINNMRTSVLNGSLSAAVAYQASMEGVTAAVSSELLTHEPFDLSLPGNQPIMNDQPSQPPSGAPLDDPSLFTLNINVGDAGSSAADIENFISSAVEEMFPNLDATNQRRNLLKSLEYNGYNIVAEATRLANGKYRVIVYIYKLGTAAEDIAGLRTNIINGDFDLRITALAVLHGFAQSINEIDSITRFFSESPSSSPSDEPSTTPSVAPSDSPSSSPSSAPSDMPSGAPSNTPSVSPSGSPSSAPSSAPSGTPSGAPSDQPSTTPSLSPSGSPSSAPSSAPSGTPSGAPSGTPSLSPSGSPSSAPSSAPSGTPSGAPSGTPSLSPSMVPSVIPSVVPSSNPSISSNPTSIEMAFTSVIEGDLTAEEAEELVLAAIFALLLGSESPSVMPSSKPSLLPSGMPSSKPSEENQGGRRYLRSSRSLPPGEEIIVTRLSENRLAVMFVVSSPQDLNFVARVRESVYNGEWLSAIYNQASLSGFEHLIVEVEDISDEPSSVTNNLAVDEWANRTAPTFSETSGEKLSTSHVKTVSLLPQWATIWMSILSALLVCILLYMAYTSWAKKQVLE